MARPPLYHRFFNHAILAVLALPALWPFLHEGLPRSNDHLTHVYRAVQLAELLRAGQLLPRWAPDLVFGYGYPIFNYFPYLSHSAVALAILAGVSALTAYKLICALALVGSAWNAYALGRELFDESSAGLVTGVAYLYSPYLLYDAHIRGSAPESLALALLPLALLHLRRAAHGQLRSMVWAGLALGACLFAHHGVTLQAMPFVMAYGVFCAWQFSKQAAASRTKIASLVLVPSAFVLAFFLTAFFWLPALLEAPFVQTERGTLNGGMLYTNNFLSLGELIAWPRLPVDPDLLNPPVVRPLPLAALLIAGLALSRATSHSLRPTLLFFTFAAALAVLLLHPISRPLWDNLPLLRLTLFPWRLLGPIALFVAVLAGALFSRPPTAVSRPPSAVMVSIVIGVLVIAGLPFASPPFEPVPPYPTVADMAAFEIPPDFIGTTTVGEYLPRAVQQLPADASARRDPSRRPRYAAPGATVTHRPLSPTRDSFTIAAETAITFTYNQFYFPGWQATLDSQPIALRITRPEGLMALDLPAGTHTLTFELADTWPRSTGNLLSALGVSVAVIVLVTGGRRHAENSERQREEKQTPTFYFLLSTVALTFALARPLIYDAGLTPLLRHGLTPEGLRGVVVPLNHNFADELTLLGWDASPAPLPTLKIGADDTFTVSLYWRANRPLGVPYGFDVRLVDARGFIWSERETPRPRDWRFTPGTDHWPPDQYVLDPYRVTPLAGTPPGEYLLQVEVFSRYDFRSLGKLQFGTVTITSPSHRACEGATGSAAPGLQFVAFSQAQAAPGDDLLVTSCWRGTPPLSTFNLKLGNRLHLSGNDRIVPHTKTGATDLEAVTRHQLSVRLPADLGTGRYTWTLQAGTETFELGQLEVSAPARVYLAPPVGRAVSADLGPATLYGFDAPLALKPGDIFPLTLVWRAEALFDAPYHVFVHLTNADGIIMAQSDGTPANGGRRTTGWLPGEHIADPRPLALPADLAPGIYTLSAGLYRPDTGERLTTPHFAEGRVVLEQFQLP